MCDLPNCTHGPVKARVHASATATPPPLRRKAPAIRTHEWYIGALAAAFAKASGLTKADKAALAKTRLAFGWGERGQRAVTVSQAWHNGKAVGDLVSINAGMNGQPLDLAEAVGHELGHVLAGVKAGHTATWKAACARLGYPHVRVTDSGKAISWADFDPAMAKRLRAVALPNDGSGLDPRTRPSNAEPVHSTQQPDAVAKVRPCGAGWGSQGGSSRGKGAGSRYVLYQCQCKPRPFKVRHAGFELDATCNRCGHGFALVDDSVAPSSTWGTGQRPDGNGGAKPSHGGVRAAGKRREQGTAADRVNAPLPDMPKPGAGEIPF